MRSLLFSLSLRATRGAWRTSVPSALTRQRLRLQVPVRCASSSKKETDSAKEEEKAPKKGLIAKMKGLWKDYGYQAVLCYASLYFLNLGGLMVALETDVLHLHEYGFDAPAILDMMCGKYEELTGRKELGVIIHEHPRYGIFALALFLNDFFEPLRIGGTIFFLSKLAKKRSE